MSDTMKELMEELWDTDLPLKKIYKPGRNPNSLANLNKRDCSQNHATRLAAQINWLKRSLMAAQAHAWGGSIASYVQAARSTMSEERKVAIDLMMAELQSTRVQILKTIEAIDKIKDTPIRTPQARKELLKRRQERRKNGIKLS